MWPMFPFSKVAEIVTGNTPPKKDPDNYGPGVPWVKPPDLDSWEPIISTSETLSPKGQQVARLLPVGAVMVCCIGSIGRVGIAGTTLATNQQINSLVFGQCVIPEFGYYYCRSISHVFKSEARNAVVPILNKSNFAKIKMPVPPLSEQQRIVEILSQADALRKQRAEADKKATRILAALFYQMFGDPATNSKGWPMRPLRDMCDIVSGATPKTSRPEFWGGGIAWATPKDLSTLDDWVIESTERTLTEEGFSSCSATMMPGEAVLLSSRAPIGLVAISAIPICTNQGFKSLVCGPEIDPWYLFAWCKLRKSYFESLGRGATFKEISKRIVENIEIPLPPMDMQKRFRAVLQDLRFQRLRARKARDRIDELFVVLLHRAFSGDLTAKWRKAHMKELLQEMEHQARALG